MAQAEEKYTMESRTGTKVVLNGKSYLYFGGSDQSCQ